MPQSLTYLLHNLKVTDDPFSDVLALISAKSVVSGTLAAGGSWGVRFPPSDRINFWGIARGCCWCATEGEEPFFLEAGDFMLRAAPRSTLLASDLKATPVDFQNLMASSVGNTFHHGKGDDFLIVGGKVEFDIRLGAPLLATLPPTILIRHASTHATVLQWLLAQLVRERADAMPGVAAASAQLAQLMFIQILRAHLDSDATLAPGWLRLLGSRRLAPAVRLLHQEPAKAWGLEELASACSMSRATFAVHFKADAGITPVAYLTQLRMRLAERTLREGNTSVSKVGYELGYSSESAFSNAFKRFAGEAPTRYRAKARSNQAAS
jgi:AraC-like DNA-binding protein